jgi:hypothetical protein
VTTVTEIVFHIALATAPSLALAASGLPGWAGPLLAIVLGLGMLGVYLRRLLFTPVEEAVLVPEARSLREPPPPERYRLGHLGLLRFSRPH